MTEVAGKTRRNELAIPGVAMAVSHHNRETPAPAWITAIMVAAFRVDTRGCGRLPPCPGPCEAAPW
jgi:hypothetical protein